MKTPLLAFLTILVVALFLTACATTVTKNTLPDGTVVEVTAKSADPVAIKAALDAANTLAPIIAGMVDDQKQATP